MPRVPRSSLPDGYFHVFARAVATGGPLFRDDDDHRTFVRLAEDAGRRSGWTCHAYCLMGTHYHLVVESTRHALSRGLERLNGLYARYFNVRHDRFGHVFAGRFSARVIEGETYLYDACSYVLSTPSRPDYASGQRTGRGRSARSSSHVTATT
jgi:putative transposase